MTEHSKGSNCFGKEQEIANPKQNKKAHQCPVLDLQARLDIMQIRNLCTKFTATHAPERKACYDSNEVG